MATQRCDECGAAARAENDRFCSFCGAAYELPPPPASSHEAKRVDVERRFALLERHPRAQSALRDRPTGAETVARHGVGAVFAVVFAIFAAAIAVFMISGATEVQRGFDSFPSPDLPGGVSFPGGGGGAQDAFFSIFKIFPFVIVGFAIFIAVRTMARTARVAGSPTIASLGHVLDEHTETRGSRDHTRTVHVVTLEDADGQRSSYEIPRGVAHGITTGDMGIVHSKGGELVRFTRVDV